MGYIILVTFYPSLPLWIKFYKIMLPMLKLDTNYGFHELFLNFVPSCCLDLLQIVKQHVCESKGKLGSGERNNCKLSEMFHIFPYLALKDY
jgi:hypothetical protein